MPQTYLHESQALTLEHQEISQTSRRPPVDGGGPVGVAEGEVDEGRSQTLVGRRRPTIRPRTSQRPGGESLGEGRTSGILGPPLSCARALSPRVSWGTWRRPC